ncbi:enoyl-CoA hydratase [Mycobacterium heckeshornense]|uniref:enoyl-CoA hydratase-related protein n=1 Tax=Mycobacterium heckeshornense TaxID=110505 RepID=UPI001941E933|nr:enoyl-CoA hydratase-related protein [Mycobacterium heckeshornense]BCQ07290.1 enoyl-CoA hydratase [Mycobacterium heckeshornense]
MTQTTTDHDLVKLTVTDGVAVLTWNRPERNNAWTVPMETRYYQLLEQCAQDTSVRVIVVTGAGRSFCPGMDAHVLAENAQTGATTNPHLRKPFTLPRTIPKPIIAAINGACAGIGLVAAMNCDLRFASSTAKLTTSFAHRGIMAEHGLAWSLPRAVGVSTALDLLFSARVILAQEALDLGVVDRVYEPDELMPETLEYARNLAVYSSPLAMGVIKRQVYAAQESSHEEARALALRYWMGILRHHPDFKEGISSYLEKRPPRFAPWDPLTPTDPPPLPG